MSEKPAETNREWEENEGYLTRHDDDMEGGKEEGFKDIEISPIRNLKGKLGESSSEESEWNGGRGGKRG